MKRGDFSRILVGRRERYCERAEVVDDWGRSRSAHVR